MDNEILKAYAEIDYILSFIPQKYVMKIPLKLRDKFNKEKDTLYIVNIVSNKNLKDQKLLKKTKSILAVLKYNYWCENDEEKEKLYNKFKENELKYQKEMREKYNPDNIFKNKDNTVEAINSTKEIIEYKESIIKRIFNKIKNIFIR